MYRYLHTVEAMSTINPQLNKQLGIDVAIYDTNEGPIPHIHVFLDKTRNPKNCAVVRLDKAEYSTHHGEPVVKMNKKQKDQFIRIMTSEWPGRYIEYNGHPVPATGYEYAVSIWVESFEDGSYDKFMFDSNGVLVMPDYSSL